MSARVLLAGLLLLGGCEPPPGAPGEGPGPAGGETGVGSFSMSLTLGGGYRIGDVGYDVSGNGFHKAGVINAAASTTVSAIVDGIPFGAHYLLQLTAQDVDHKLGGCTGSASFDVTSAAVVPVPVQLTCHQLRPVQAVPIPRWASLVLAALLLGLGAVGQLPTARRRGRRRARSAPG